MPHAIMSLFDPGALGIVAAGTVIGTAARCGWRDFAAALKASAGLVHGSFRLEANRKALAQVISAIQRDGHRRADPALPPDRALALMVETYLRRGVMEPISHIRRAERSLDEARRLNAAQVFVWAGELAPVFGLVGTLLGFTQLAAPAGADATATIMTAVSTAVLTSLYGALIAHLICFPLAGAIERRGLAEEQHREALADWFMAQIKGSEAATQAYRAHLREVS